MKTSLSVSSNVALCAALVLSVHYALLETIAKHNTYLIKTQLTKHTLCQPKEEHSKILQLKVAE